MDLNLYLCRYFTLYLLRIKTWKTGSDYHCATPNFFLMIMCRHRHLPKPIYKASALRRIMIDAERRKEERRRAHSAPGSMPKESVRKRRIVKEIEWISLQQLPELLVLYNWGICRAQVLSYGGLVQAIYDAAGFGLSRLSWIPAQNALMKSWYICVDSFGRLVVLLSVCSIAFYQLHVKWIFTKW